mgnify:CR=1 FL=1
MELSPNLMEGRMPMNPPHRSGVFSPEEIDAMCLELEENASTEDTELSRRKRAASILARFEAMREERDPAER